MCTSQLYLVKSDKKNRVMSNVNNYVTNLFGEHSERAIPIPCGSCIECRMAKASEWAFRCMKEAAEYKDNIMVTLTYDDNHLPKSTKIDSETGECLDSYTLNHRDVQLFIKRLRKKYGDNIKIYGCGEYGSDKEYIDWKGQKRVGTERPHYHIILFNLKIDDLEFWKMSKCDWSSIQNPLFKSDTISKLWNKGHADLNEVNYETCRYVAGYVMKKWKGRGSDEHYMLKGQKPPYTFCSRRPGIGHAFFMRNKDKFLNEETFWQKTRKGVVELPPIRYFDKLMDKEDSVRLQEIKDKRIQKSIERDASILKNTDIQMYEYINNHSLKVQEKQKFNTHRYIQ